MARVLSFSGALLPPTSSKIQQNSATKSSTALFGNQVLIVRDVLSEDEVLYLPPTPPNSEKLLFSSCPRLLFNQFSRFKADIYRDMKPASHCLIFMLQGVNCAGTYLSPPWSSARPHHPSRPKSIMYVTVVVLK